MFSLPLRTPTSPDRTVRSLLIPISNMQGQATNILKKMLFLSLERGREFDGTDDKTVPLCMRTCVSSASVSDTLANPVEV